MLISILFFSENLSNNFYISSLKISTTFYSVNISLPNFFILIVLFSEYSYINTSIYSSDILTPNFYNCYLKYSFCIFFWFSGLKKQLKVSKFISFSNIKFYFKNLNIKSLHNY